MSQDTAASRSLDDPGTIFVQYNGTDICFDFHCECGSLGHFDGYFAYSVECTVCGRKYTLPHTFALLPYDEGSNTVEADMDQPAPGVVRVGSGGDRG